MIRNFKMTILLSVLLSALSIDCEKKKSEKAEENKKSNVTPSSKKQTPQERDKAIRNMKLSPKMWDIYEFCIKIGQATLHESHLEGLNVKKRCTLYVYGLVTKKPIPHPYFKKDK